MENGNLKQNEGKNYELHTCIEYLHFTFCGIAKLFLLLL